MRNNCPVCMPFWCRWAVLWPIMGWLLAGCSLDSGRQGVVALPTGHYEGPISYQGTELRAVLDLRESQPGQLEADLRFPDLESLDFAATNLSYTEPQLRFEEAAQPNGIRISAIREGDFLRGIFAFDSIRADFVWVRRGQPEPRAYQLTKLPARADIGAPGLTLLVPNDTATQHAAVVLFTDAAHRIAVGGRASQLAEQGFVTTVVTLAPAASPDSTTLQMAKAVLLAMRRAPATDSTRIGLWAQGNMAALVAPAATLIKPRAAFIVLENVSVASIEETKPFQALSRQRVPVLALYAAADTVLDAKESARRLRNAMGRRRGTIIRTFSGAGTNFRLPGGLNEEGKWTWPRSAPGYVHAVQEWRQ